MVTAAGMVCAISSAQAGDLPLRLVSITRPVNPGGVVTLVIQTAPGAACSGRRQGHAGNAYSIPLAPQAAEADGRVQWHWSVRSGTHPIGQRGVHVTCSAGTRSNALDTTFDVE